jgi:hypothetical protein
MIISQLSCLSKQWLILFGEMHMMHLSLRIVCLLIELFGGFSDCRYKNQNVAVKIINKGETLEEISRREGRFGREVAMLSKVRHKNLVKVFFHHSKM